MAWLDDRLWCHPKVAVLSDAAFRAHVNAITYSCGMSTAGTLSSPLQRLVGANKKIADELIAAGLWDHVGPNGTITIHDWDEHNGKRDERRRKDRERKREMRSAGRPADSPPETTRTEARTGAR